MKKKSILEMFLSQKLNGNEPIEDFRFFSEKMPSINEQDNSLETF
ncbi:hypothetical protein DB43_AG00110 [Parachlamydia acanthamoebae]|nr:hypothetical protein DB43_AG00110 [Parachlamydia acanthamoebae]